MDSLYIYLQLANVLVVLIFVVTLVGCVVPIVPGPLMLALAVLIHKLLFPDVLLWKCVILCIVIGGVSQIMDFVLSWFGAKKYGATWRGAFGATLGAVIALFVPPQIITIFIFPFMFALFFEYCSGQNFEKSLKAGWGAFLGSIGAMVFKIVCCFAIVVVFLFDAY